MPSNRPQRGELGCFGSYMPEHPCTECELASWCIDCGMRFDDFWDRYDHNNWLKECEEMEVSMHRWEEGCQLM